MCRIIVEHGKESAEEAKEEKATRTLADEHKNEKDTRYSGLSLKEVENLPSVTEKT